MPHAQALCPDIARDTIDLDDFGFGGAPGWLKKVGKVAATLGPAAGMAACVGAGAATGTGPEGSKLCMQSIGPITSAVASKWGLKPGQPGYEQALEQEYAAQMGEDKLLGTPKTTAYVVLGGGALVLLLLAMRR